MAQIKKSRRNKNKQSRQAATGASAPPPCEKKMDDGYLYLGDPGHMARQDPQMAEALEVIAEKSKLGAYLVETARKLDVRFVRQDFNAASVGGSNRGNVIALSADNLLAVDITVLPHELMHWLQPEDGIQDRWDYRSRLLAVLSREAGAETCAVRVTHEMRENGYADAFNRNARAPHWCMYRDIYQTFDQVLQSSREAGFDDAVRQATDAAFRSYFKQPGLIGNYGGKVLTNYMYNLGRLAKHYPTPGFSLQAAANQARLQGGECLVYEPVQLPLRDDDLFKGNATLRQAFEYAEMIHIAKFCQQDTALAYQRKVQALKADNNPFLGLNYSKVRSEYCGQIGQKNPRSMLRIMTDMAGVENFWHRQAGFDFG